METNSESDNSESIYHSTKRPTISLNDYLQRIGKYAHCREECFVFALIYIDRLQELQPEIVLNSKSAHRLSIFINNRMILVACIVAIKFHEDEYYKNDYYAKVGGIALDELNVLESQFLLHINFKLYISETLFNTYTTKL